jgi:ABC-type uncharacterized transport system auxiliary subunit
MNRRRHGARAVAMLLFCTILAGCASVPEKKYFVLNYVPSALPTHLSPAPYPYTLRLKEFNIEEAYNRPQIVYRQSPFELQYYFYKVWAVKPTQMITDLIYKHLTAIGLISSIVRRFDEGTRPQYELSGMIEAIDEYDSDQVWFAHLALRFQLSRISDGRIIYSRRFDNRKRVFENKPEYVIKEMSSIMEFVMNQVAHDLDVSFNREAGMGTTGDIPMIPAGSDSVVEVPEDRGAK